MPYTIKQYSRDKARKLGVMIRPSSQKKKKIDVYYNNKKIASIGHTDYMDYPSYIEKAGKEYADERRRLYRIRHAGEGDLGNKAKFPNAFYAWHILW